MNQDQETRNSAVLNSFVAYCRANPSQRFWQALLNWSQLPFIAICAQPPGEYRHYNVPVDVPTDPYNWEGRNGDEL
jgi:hypothetical protein